jgi:phosphatidylserine decarboxylase
MPVTTPRSARALRPLASLAAHERLNFLLTNRIPRIALTRLMGRYSKLRSRWLTRASLAVWRLFTDIDLSDARTADFRSLHEVFTRELAPGSRPIDPDAAVLVSPCDAIVGACGAVDGTRVFQAKGFPYEIGELFGSDEAAAGLAGGCYATLRLTSAMYHRFHAVDDGEIERVTYLSGDAWNVNPIALSRIERLFCRNERVVITQRLDDAGQRVSLVAVAAVLVASVRLHWLDVVYHLRWRGPAVTRCAHRCARGDELGWFEHGSTIIVVAPAGFALADGIEAGRRLRMGEALMRRPNR